MALSSNIPTSFVPQPATPRRLGIDFFGAFSLFSYIVLAVVFMLTLGVFFYGQVLKSQLQSKDNAVKAATNAISTTAATSFLRLQDRLVSSEGLLNGHVAFSNFFAVIGKSMPDAIRFTSIHVQVDATTGAPALEGAGVAKSFNALASASAAFAADGRIKDAIFSGIKVSRTDNSVSFQLAATLDPKLVAFQP